MKRHTRRDSARSVVTQRAVIRKKDNWLNVLTGLGDPDKDKRLGAGITFRRVIEREVEDLYGADWTAGKIVDLPTEDALRNWFDFSKCDPAAEAAINAEYERLFFRDRLTEALRLSRIYGGAAMIPICDGGGLMDEPLMPEQVLKIRSILVLSRFELTGGGLLVRDPGSPYFGLPVSYGVNPRGASYVVPMRVHHTRVIRINGNFLPRQLFQQNDYWHDSVLNKVINAVRNYATSFDSAAGLILDYRQGILKSNGIAERISAGQEDAVKNRLRVFNLTRSVLSTMVIDKENEEYEQQTFPLTGVAEILDKMENQVAAAADIPRTKLFGEGATGGLGNEGKSQKKDWQAKIAGIQDTRLRQPIMAVTNLITSSSSFPSAARSGIEQGWGIKFRPVDVMDETETAELRNKQSQTDINYIREGVLSAEEVAASRFGGPDGYSLETKLAYDRKPEEETEIDGDPET